MKQTALSLGVTTLLSASLMAAPALAGVEQSEEAGENRSVTQVQKSTEKAKNPQNSQDPKKKAKTGDQAKAAFIFGLQALSSITLSPLSASFNDPSLPQPKKPAADSTNPFIVAPPAETKTEAKPPAKPDAKLAKKTVRGVLLDVANDTLYIKHRAAHKTLARRLTAAGFQRIFEKASKTKISTYSIKKLSAEKVKTLPDIVFETRKFVIVVDADGTEYVTDIL